MASPLRRFLFVSYSQADSGPVAKFLRVLREEIAKGNLELELWRDRDNLLPGTVWETSIREALDRSVGLLVFVSESSFRSEWVRAEIESVLKDSNKPIVPILLDSPLNVPASLRQRQWIDLSGARGVEGEMRSAAKLLLKALAPDLNSASAQPLSSENSSKFASFVAEAAREQERTPIKKAPDVRPPDSVFVVHGHDSPTLELICNTLTGFGVSPVVLAQSLGQSQSLLQKFLDVAHKARFAIVVLSSDDYGASRLQYDIPGVTDRSLQFRARQNVVLELGFFYGRLGWENVFVLWKAGPAFPNFERPSDLDGAVFDAIDDRGKWKQTLESKLRDAGFALALSGEA